MMAPRQVDPQFLWIVRSIRARQLSVWKVEAVPSCGEARNGQHVVLIAGFFPVC